MSAGPTSLRQLEEEARRACGHLFVRVSETGCPRFFWRVAVEISHQGAPYELARVAQSKKAARAALAEALRTLTPPPPEVQP